MALSDRVAYWVLALLSLGSVAGIITVILLAQTEVPSPVDRARELDVIVLDRGRQRLDVQLQRVGEHMPWVRSLVVLRVADRSGFTAWSPDEHPLSTSAISLLFFEVSSAEPDVALRELRAQHPDLHQHVLCLGDHTAPVRDVRLDQLYSHPSGKLRLFNYLSPQALTSNLRDHFEALWPAVVINIPELLEAGSMDHYILSLTVAQQTVYAPSLNRNFILVQHEGANHQQLDRPLDTSEFFVTYSIPDSLTPTVQDRVNQRVLRHMWATRPVGF